MKASSIEVYAQSAVIASVSVIVYFNVINAPFLHDDNPAILKNPDVQETNGILTLWKNDFWGTPIRSSSSHKSYRPVTILFFRCIHMIWGNCSTPYHLINIMLHALVSVLLFLFSKIMVYCPKDTSSSFMVGLLFALHPIHTEAVCGVVGCAELLSAAFFFLSLIIYCWDFDGQAAQKRIKTKNFDSKRITLDNNLQTTLRQRKTQRVEEAVQENYDTTSKKLQDAYCNRPKKYFNLISSLFGVMLAMLSKESGVAALGLLFTCAFIKHFELHRHLETRTSIFLCPKLIFDIIMISLWGFLLILFRLWIMTWTLPTFSISDNPVAYEKYLQSRILTSLQIYWYNLRLLLFPNPLCYDYSFGTIATIRTLWDPRNIFLIFVIVLVAGGGFLANSFRIKNSLEKSLVIGYLLMVFPFLPASNLFFSVGFVIAERILYIPSSGFIILFVTCWNKLKTFYPSLKQYLQLFMVAVVFLYSFQTLKRSVDWTSKEKLFRSGVMVAPNNAKIRYNWANYLREKENYQEAAKEYRIVLELEPTYVSAMNNLGTILEESESTVTQAEELYVRAIQIEPRHENAYNNLAKIMMKQGRYEEATKVLLKAIQAVSEGLTHVTYTTTAAVLVKQNEIEKAENLYVNMLSRSCFSDGKKQVISKKCSQENIPALSNYAELLLKKGQTKKALNLYNEVYKMNSTDQQINSQILVGLAKAQLANEDFEEAIKTMLRALSKTSSIESDLWSMAAELFRLKRYMESRKLYENLIKADPNNFQAAGQYAVVLYQEGRHKHGKDILINITSKDIDCKNDEPWRNLATIYGKESKHQEAIQLLSKCLENIEKREPITDKAENRIVSKLLCEISKHKRDRSAQIMYEVNNHETACILIETAVANLQKAMKIDPNNIEAGTILKSIRRNFSYC